MYSRYWYVTDSHLALVASPYSHWGSFVWEYHVQVSLFFFFFATDTFEDNVGFVGFLDCDHVYYGLILHCDGFGEGCFTDLAFELWEVVADHDLIQLFLHFAVDPVFQTPHMDELTWPLTLAGVNQRVFRGWLIAEAHLAGSHQCFLDRIVPLVQLQVRGLFVGFRFTVVPGFQHHIFYSPQFYDIAWTYITWSILKGYPSTPSSFWNSLVTKKLLWNRSGWSYLIIGWGSTPVTVADCNRKSPFSRSIITDPI